MKIKKIYGGEVRWWKKMVLNNGKYGLLVGEQIFLSTLRQFLSHLIPTLIGKNHETTKAPNWISRRYLERQQWWKAFIYRPDGNYQDEGIKIIEALKTLAPKVEDYENARR